MLTRRIDVRIGARAVPVGELIFEADGTRETSAFTYHDSWRALERAFPLSPDMPLGAAPFYGRRDGERSALPLPMTDTAPDSWGRKIIELLRGTQYLTELDYLLESDDRLRIGALRYFDGLGAEATALAPPRADGVNVPRLHDLDEVIRQARAFEEDPAGYARRRAELVGGDLLAEAVGSLGGARPKVNARDTEGALWIVKLPKIDDDYAVARAEVMTLRLARDVGIDACVADILNTSQRFPAALIRRFDRVGADHMDRVPFISAQTFLGLGGTSASSYEDLAMAMRRHCVDPTGQIAELYRRMVFGILIRNTDDHLRNHGFLRAPGGWRLSPAFDINPEHRAGGRMQTAISEIHGNLPSIDAALDASAFFDIERRTAEQMTGDMARHIAGAWRRIGGQLVMDARDFSAMGAAIETEDLARACRL
jgi:serine/threonine-protein kinase HipA